VQHGDDRRLEVPRQAADELLERFDPAGGRADHDEVVPGVRYIPRHASLSVEPGYS
jgi:hypothetical protein